MNTAARAVICLLTLVLSTFSAQAQCPSAAQNLNIEVGLCRMRLTWTPTLIFATNQVVLRSPTSSVADATTIAVLGATTSTFEDAFAIRGATYTYWIRTTPAIATCSSPVSTPVSGRLQTGSALPTFELLTCNTVVVSCPALYDATTYLFSRIDIDGSNRVDFPPSSTNSYADTTTVPGKHYAYFANPLGSCGGYPTLNPNDVFGPGVPGVEPPTNAVVVVPGQNISMTAEARSEYPMTFRWFKDSSQLTASSRILGADTRVLTIVSARPEDAGAYTFEATNSCGPASTRPFAVAVRTICRADYNFSGSLTVNDIFDFLNAWFAGCP